jgi:hypothetical protein
MIKARIFWSKTSLENKLIRFAAFQKHSDVKKFDENTFQLIEKISKTFFFIQAQFEYLGPMLTNFKCP